MGVENNKSLSVYQVIERLSCIITF